MTSRTLNLRDFKIPLKKLAPLEYFKSRQGDRLSYRFYPAWSEDLIVLYHGVGGDSRYMCVLAAALADAGYGSVVTPDFRGHGGSLELDKDISSSQLEIDLEELLIHLKMLRSISQVTLAGHSLGGGFVLRVATSALQNQFVKYVALAPYLPPTFGIFQEGLGGWIEPNPDGGFAVKLPSEYITGQEKLSYNENYLHAIIPATDLLERLRAMKLSVAVIVGADDELMHPARYKELLEPCGVVVNIEPGLNHLTLVSKPEAWLRNFL